MSASIAIAQTTLALCDMLQTSLRRDAGWRLTGATARVTSLPHGKPDTGSGARLNVALVSVAPGAMPPQMHGSPPPPVTYDMRFLVTAHVFSDLHSELLIGGALQALYGNPVLMPASPDSASDDALKLAVLEGSGRAPDSIARLSVEAVPGPLAGDIRLPALIITVSNVVALPDVAPSLLIR